MNAPRLVFAGTPDFALASLKALSEAGFKPIAVMTQPDRPAGRGRKLRPSPVKKFALRHEIEVLQPATLKDPEMVQSLADLEPDVIVVAAYGLLLPQAVLKLPRHGCVNVHASLLPRWRGAAPIQAAIIAGDRETGISLMQMEAGLDTGAVYAQRAIPIDDDDTAGDLHDRLARLGGRLLAENMRSILDGSLKPQPQDEDRAIYAAKIRTPDATIDWARPADELQRRVRAYNPVPGARFQCNGESIKCWEARLGSVDTRPTGKVLAADAGGIEVACGKGSLILMRLQRPGRRPVSAGEFAAQLDLVGRRFE